MSERWRKKIVINSNLTEASWLTALAGWADAVGFMLVANVFVSFMSGNSTQLMVALITGSIKTVTTFTIVIISFLSGVSTGAYMAERHIKKHSVKVFLIESLMIWMAVGLVSINASPLFFLPLLTFAMGIHNTALQEDNNLMVKTYISGTLVSLGQAIGQVLSGKSINHLLNPLCIFLSFVVGALSSTFISVQFSPIISLSLLAVFLSSLTIVHHIAAP